MLRRSGSLAGVISVGGKPNLSFPVKVVHGGAVRVAAFAELLQRKTIVSIYMKNNTASCDRQTDALRALVPTLARAGVDVVAVSRDTAGAHQRYAAARGICYPLVSDPQDQFARAVDALVEKTMYGRRFVGPARSAYLLGPDGEVLAVIPKVDAANHAAQVLAAINLD